MTQYYRVPGFSLASANASTKVLVSLFLLLVLGGLAVALLQYADRAGFDRKGTVEWVRGNESDLAAKEIRSPKTYTELLAITHEHAFSLPILLLVLLHLVGLCPIGEKAKIGMYVAGFASLAGALAGPWLVSYGGPGASVLVLGSGLVLALVLGGSALLPLYEMWLAGPLRARWERPEPPPADPLFPQRPGAPPR
jgi:hypothetical protein